MFRYALQRYGTWAWIDYEAAIVTSDGPEWCRSAYGIMRATVPAPAAHRIVADDGRDVFEEWGTFVHVETDSRTRRWTGIVSEAELTERGWDLTIIEFPGYFRDVPFQGMIRGVEKDPVALLRELVVDSQSIPGAWFGCSVTGSTPVRVGTNLDDLIASARATMDARKQQLDAFSKTSSDTTKSVQDLSTTMADEVSAARSLVAQAQQQVSTLLAAGATEAEIAAARSAEASRRAAYNAALASYNAELSAGRAALANAVTTKELAQAAYNTAKASYDALRERRKEEEGAYVIGGGSLPDTYKAIQDLAARGFEWFTRTTYSEDAPNVEIVARAPTVGARRDDLVFDTDINIVDPLTLESTEYANAVIGVGAGEGDAAIRRTMYAKTARMYRPTVFEDRSATTSVQLDSRMRQLLGALSGRQAPVEFEVRDHPNCPIGAWSVGDLITVRGTTSLGARWSGLVRIESWSWPSEFRAKLQVSSA